uniref:Uncharacterized protein n=1 Tax=Arundo donax TaxID=35708 RepID=A0A0A9G367_ARUDO
MKAEQQATNTLPPGQLDSGADEVPIHKMLSRGFRIARKKEHNIAVGALSDYVVWWLLMSLSKQKQHTRSQLRVQCQDYLSILTQ